MSEFDGMLDLTGADTSVGTFDAAPSGTYHCIVDDGTEMKFVGPDAKLPEGTPYLNVWWRVHPDEPERKGVKVANKVFFQKLFIPPADYGDKEYVARARGSLVNFLRAIGFTDEQVASKKFNLNSEWDSIIGQEADVVVKKFRNDYTEADDNSVQGVKPLGSGSQQKAGSLL